MPSRFLLSLTLFSSFSSTLVFAQPVVMPGSILSAETRRAASLTDVRSTMSSLYARAGVPSARYPVERFRLKIRTTDEANRSITVSALLYVPVLPKGQSASLYVMGAGTTGIMDECAPTRENARADNWGDYEAHMLSYATQGYVSILPDWANFDDERAVQPYFVSNAEGRVMLDAARAAFNFVRERANGPEMTGKVFLAGYSQGGHGAFAAADMAASYAPELKIGGVIGYAPAMDVATLFRERPVLGPYLARSYAERYGVDTRKLLQDRWLTSLDGASIRACVSTVARHYPNDGASLYRPSFWQALQGGSLRAFDSELSKLVKLNSPGFDASGRVIPAIVLTGLTDPIVTANAQLTFIRKSCAFGRAIVQREYEGANHYQARQFGFADTLRWMREREAGLTAPTSCSTARYQTLMKGNVNSKVEFASKRKR
ncbi:lipase family protein [Deinococcus yavapaiensis]|nr:lipase family protein [Deinococcus yavapaiensis]